MVRDLVHEPPSKGIELRLPTGPSGPDLPLDTVLGPGSGGRPVVRSGRVDGSSWSLLRMRAQRRGISSAAVLMSVVADALRLWSQQSDFGLDFVLPGQEVGLALAFDVLPQDSFRARADRLNHQLDRCLAAGRESTHPVRAGRLGCVIVEEDDDLEVTWTLEGGAGKGGAAEGFCADLVGVVVAAVGRLARSPEAWDAGGPVVGLPPWQRQERAEANRTAGDLPVTTLCQLVEDRAAVSPDAVAVIAADAELTYRDVRCAARALADRLAAAGAAAGVAVGVVMDRVSAQVPAVLGVTMSGAAYVPIDPQWPAARRSQVLEQGDVRIVVTTPELRDRADWPADILLLTLDDEQVRRPSPEVLGRRPVPASPQDVAYVIFTSGSTGQPKGVMVEHGAAANTVQDINRRFRVGPGDRVLALSALSFDLSVYDLFGSLAAGAAVVIPDPGRAHDPQHWSDLVRRHAVTVWNSVPALMRLWLDDPSSGTIAPGLRLVLLSGDWIAVSLPDAIRAVHPQAQVISLGGATEASIWSVIFPIGPVPTSWTRIPYGRPLTNQTLQVLDPDLGPRPVWVVGEIHIGGVGLARGYRGDPARTAERFIVHPGSGERLYRTGDLGRYLPGGDIEVLGRADSQVKLNGFRVELDEIAAVLCRQPGVGAAAITVGTNPATGHRQLVAHVVPERVGEVSSPDPDDETWSRVLAAGAGELARVSTELAPDIISFREFWHRLEAAAPAVMARALVQVGAFAAAGDTVTADQVVSRCGVREVHRGLVRQWLVVLAAGGLLEATDRAGEYRARRVPPVERLTEVIEGALGGRSVAGPSGTGSRPGGCEDALLDYFRACVHHQPALLSGRTRALRLLVPDGDWRVTRALYATNPVARMQNRVLAAVVSSFVGSAATGDRTRILEVGAGTGATADQVLDAVPTARVRYHFTDISTAFTTAARARYRDVHPNVTYGSFDIDADAGRQGLAPGSAEVVVAANVLHDAKDLDAALTRLRGLLTPGGLLVLVEGTVNSPLNLISFAFLEGFATCQDQREATLLPGPVWQERLRRAGFAQVASVPAGPPAVDALAQHVLVARAPTGVADRPTRAAQPDPGALQEALTALLPEHMVPHHYLPVERLPLTANGKVDRSALAAPWDARVGQVGQIGWVGRGEGQSHTAPRTDLERRLHTIWHEVLGHDDFGVDDDFFELGGDSLHAVRIIGRLRTEFGIQQAGDEAVDLLFQAPTVAALAKTLEPDLPATR